MVVLDRGNCARFRKRFLITFFGLFSENKENSYYCHENSFGDYANRHFRTHDLKLILQTRHRTSHTRPVGGLQIFVLHKIFSIKTPRQFLLSAGAFLIGGEWSAATGTILVMSQVFTFFPGS